jgi:putative sterol carrier protein
MARPTSADDLTASSYRKTFATMLEKPLPAGASLRRGDAHHRRLATHRRTGSDMSEGVPAEYLAQPDRYFLEWIPQLLRDNAAAARKLGRVDSVAQFHLTGDGGGSWHVVLGDGQVRVGAGRHGEPSFSLTMDIDIWRRLNRGELSGVRAWLRGDIVLTGSRLRFLRVARLFS